MPSTGSPHHLTRTHDGEERREGESVISEIMRVREPRGASKTPGGRVGRAIFLGYFIKSLQAEARRWVGAKSTSPCGRRPQQPLRARAARNRMLADYLEAVFHESGLGTTADKAVQKAREIFSRQQLVYLASVLPDRAAADFSNVFVRQHAPCLWPVRAGRRAVRVNVPYYCVPTGSLFSFAASSPSLNLRGRFSCRFRTSSHG